MAVIQINDLTKVFQMKQKAEGLSASVRSLIRPKYQEKLAVEQVSFTVEQGETLAFLGPNGAGKSTTIKMLTGILHPTRGEAQVLGYCPWKERKHLAYRIGSVFGQKSQLWYHLPPIDTFELMSRIYELPRADYFSRRDRLIEQFDIGAYVNTPVRKLSLGERMRCELAAALLHRPQVVFLDEPTIGLDVVVKHRIRDLIREMNREEGTTVFLTSHDAGDIEQLCSRAIVINHGRIILDDKVTSMKRNFLTHKTIRLQLLQQNNDLSLPGVAITSAGGDRLQLSVDTTVVTIEQVLAHIVQHCRIADVTIEDPPMEEIISHIYAARLPGGGERDACLAEG